MPWERFRLLVASARLECSRDFKQIMNVAGYNCYMPWKYPGEVLALVASCSYVTPTTVSCGHLERLPYLDSSRMPLYLIA